MMAAKRKEDSAKVPRRVTQVTYRALAVAQNLFD